MPGVSSTFHPGILGGNGQVRAYYGRSTSTLVHSRARGQRVFPARYVPNLIVLRPHHLLNTSYFGLHILPGKRLRLTAKVQDSRRHYMGPSGRGRASISAEVYPNGTAARRRDEKGEAPRRDTTQHNTTHNNTLHHRYEYILTSHRFTIPPTLQDIYRLPDYYQAGIYKR